MDIRERAAAARHSLQKDFDSTKDIYKKAIEELNNPTWSPFGELNAIFFMGATPFFMLPIAAADAIKAFLKQESKPS